MWRYLTVVAVVGGCGAGLDDNVEHDPYGTYQAQRVITAWEPSPNFEVPLNVTVTITSSSVEMSTGQVVLTPEHTGSTWTVTTSEQWPSSEGPGAATLSYTLDVPGDGTLTGTIAAHVIFDAPSIHTDFDYTFAIDGTR